MTAVPQALPPPPSHSPYTGGSSSQQITSKIVVSAPSFQRCVKPGVTRAGAVSHAPSSCAMSSPSRWGGSRRTRCAGFTDITGL